MTDKINTIRENIRVAKVNLMKLKDLMGLKETKLKVESLSALEADWIQCDIMNLRKMIDDLNSDIDSKLCELAQEEASEYVLRNMPQSMKEYIKWMGDKLDENNIQRRNHLIADYKELKAEQFIALHGKFAHWAVRRTASYVDGRESAKRILIDMIKQGVSLSGNLLEIKEMYSVKDDDKITLSGLIVGEKNTVRMCIKALGANPNQKLQLKSEVKICEQ